ncbi:MAG TPA: SGNH/GDSL hydrolase family protein [Microlunatus sp.]|nr:SGNH/GDSL hydrolase family protein [Microlunatus sp.]
MAGDGQPLRLAVLGDSSAAGVGAPDHEAALAGQLARALAALTGRCLSWRVVARSGATARTVRRDLVDRLGDPHTRWSPHVVLVVVGSTTSSGCGRPHRFRRDVGDLLAATRRRIGSPVPVFLAGLPPVHRFPALPAPARLVFGLHARRLDRQLGRVTRELNDVFHLPVGHLPIDLDGFFAVDRFHPGPVGYRVWGRALAAQAATLPLLESPAARLALR